MESLVRCTLDKAAHTLVEVAELRHDEKVLLHVRDQDLFATEVKYHKSFYRKYTNPTVFQTFCRDEPQSGEIIVMIHLIFWALN